MRYSILLYLLIVLGINCLNAQKNTVDRVNMMIGTTGAHHTEYGGTTPAVSEPFGMTQWCAATRINGISKTMYHYSDTICIGFMATHQPAIWMGDYGFFTMMPQVNELKIRAEDRKVFLDRKLEKATPYYYSLSYKGDTGHNILTELTATSRCALFKVTYPSGAKPILFIEAGRGNPGGSIQIFPEKKEIRLYNKERHDSHLGPELKNLKGYYVLKFSEEFSAYGTWNGDNVKPSGQTDSGDLVGGYIEFDGSVDVVEIRVGSSFISYEQAEANLHMEIPAKKTFAEITAQVKNNGQLILIR